jgi:hypothetical protein
MSHLPLTCQLIEQAFAKALPSDLPQAAPALRAHLQALLGQWITQRLRDTPEQMVQLLYRIDLPEAQFHAAMMAAHPGQALACAVLPHMERKAQWRLHFRPNPKDIPPSSTD